ncbi:MAG TPA: hypothetical protein VFY84_03565 [Jiangellales bacterium]|nr:hypothetical protein [Jiangellales bacterium]
MTVDQRGSQRGEDLIEDLLGRLADALPAAAIVRPFERTAGDELQGLLAGADHAVRTALNLVRDGSWSVGLGLGPVREPIPVSVRSATGPAFVHAREAVLRAKSSPRHVAICGPDSQAAGDAEALLALLAAIVQRRSRLGWEVADLVATGITQQEAAARLGVSPQAVSQRLHTGLWQEQRRAEPVAARLLEAADS